MKRFLALLATGALALGLTATSSNAQTRTLSTGSLQLDDYQTPAHKVTITAPVVGSPAWLAWQAAGFPNLTWSFPVPPSNTAQGGFVYSGPTSGSVVPHIAYWLPPGASSISGSGNTGGWAGAWDYATAAQLGLLNGSGTANTITKWNGAGTALVDAGLTDNGTTITTSEAVNINQSTGMGLRVRAAVVPPDNLLRVEDNTGQWRWRVDQNFDEFLTDAGGTDRTLIRNGSASTFTYGLDNTPIGVGGASTGRFTTITGTSLPSGSTATNIVVSNAGALETRTLASLDNTIGVATDATLSGNGKTGTPLGINLTNANTWTGAQTFGAVNVGGTANLNGNVNLGDAAADAVTVNGTIAGGSPLVFDGATANANKTTFAITDPTATRTITFPDASGTVALTGSSVASITGTANQVLANATSGVAQTGAVTLTTPQNIGTASTPTFGGMTLNGALTMGAGAYDINMTSGAIVGTLLRLNANDGTARNTKINTSNNTGNLEIGNSTGGVTVSGNMAIGTTPSSNVRLVVEGVTGSQSGLVVRNTDISGSTLPVVVLQNTTGLTWGTAGGNTEGRMIRLQDASSGSRVFDLGINQGGDWFVGANDGINNQLIRASTAGVITFPQGGYLTNGVAHFTGATGTIASSLIVNGDLTSGAYSNITGVGSQSQALNMNSHLINNVTNPVAAQDAATKNYVDGKVTGAISGTQDKLAKFDATGNAVLNSSLTDNGTTITTNEFVDLGDATTQGVLRLHDNTGGLYTIAPSLGAVEINNNFRTLGTILVNSAGGNDLTIAETGLTRNGNIAINTGAANTLSTDGGLTVAGAVSISGVANMNSHKITNVTDPTAAQDAATKNYVDVAVSAVSGYLPLAGGTMSGSIDMASNSLTTVGSITGATLNINKDAAGNSTNIGTGTTTGGVDIGANGNTVSISTTGQINIGRAAGALTNIGNGLTSGQVDIEAGTATQAIINNGANSGATYIGRPGATGSGAVYVAAKNGSVVEINNTAGTANTNIAATGNTGTVSIGNASSTAVTVLGPTTVNSTGSAMTTIGNYNAGTPANSTMTNLNGTVGYSYASSGTASAYTIPQGVTIADIGNDAAITGVAVTGPAGTNGQVLYIHNGDAQPTTGFAGIPPGETWTFVYSGGAWRHAN